MVDTVKASAAGGGGPVVATGAGYAGRGGVSQPAAGCLIQIHLGGG